MKKILALTLCLLFAATLFAGCGGDDGSGDTASSSDSIISKADVVYVQNGDSVYTIIRPEEASELDETTSASLLFKQMKGVLGVTVKNVADSTDGNDKYEILLGATNRPESKQALDYLLSQDGGRYDDWIICTIGKKIVINAYSSEGLKAATEHFVKNFVKAEGVKGGIEYANKVKGDFVDITVNNVNLNKFSIVRPYFNFSYLAQVEVDKVVETVLNKTGFKPSVVFDQKAEAAEYEIIIGNAGRDGVETITDHDAYKITVSGKKIYLNGGSAHATAIAISEFGKMLESSNAITDTTKSGSYAETVKTYGDDTFKYAWGDDFDGDEIDTKKWDVYYGRKVCYADGVNGKTTYRCREDKPNTFVKDGSLYICADQTEDAYYGGMLCTQGIMRYKFGYIEISTIHPRGLGFWTALWMNSDVGVNGDYFAEIDVEECYGDGGDWAYGNTFAWPSKKCREEKNGGLVHVNNKVCAKDERGFWQDYHTFGFEWDEDHVVFTCDGFPYVEQDTHSNPAEHEALTMPFFLRLSMACGFASRGGITDDPWEWENTNKLIVDYVNIYQKPGQEIIYENGEGWQNT